MQQYCIEYGLIYLSDQFEGYEVSTLNLVFWMELTVHKTLVQRQARVHRLN